MVVAGSDQHRRCDFRCCVMGTTTSRSIDAGRQKANRCNCMGLMKSRPLGINSRHEAIRPSR